MINRGNKAIFRAVVAAGVLVLLTVGSAAGIAQAQAQRHGSAGTNAEEQQASRLVHDWLAAWVAKDADKMASYMAENVSFSGNYPAMAPESGRARWLMENAPFIKMGIKIQVHGTTAVGGKAGTAVLVRRTDTFSFNGRTLVVPVAAFYFVKNGHIQTWFDMPLIELGPPPGAPPPGAASH